MRGKGTRFIPLQANEQPGDPELGGWRPLPRLFSAIGQLPNTLVIATSIASKASAHPLTLRQAVALVGFRVNGFTLQNALSVVIGRLGKRGNAVSI